MKNQSQSLMPLAWHYTIGSKFSQIIESQYLDPKKTVTPPDERNILWFSKNNFFEPTAQKAFINQDGKNVSLGIMGNYKLGGGLIRFGYPVVKLTEYKKLCRQAGIQPDVLAALEKVAIEDGAKPSDWLGTLKRIKVKDCIIDVFNGSEWIRADTIGSAITLLEEQNLVNA